MAPGALGDHPDSQVLHDQAGNGGAELEAQLVGAIGGPLGHAAQGQAVAEPEVGLRSSSNSMGLAFIHTGTSLSKQGTWAVASLGAGLRNSSSMGQECVYTGKSLPQ